MSILAMKSLAQFAGLRGRDRKMVVDASQEIQAQTLSERLHSDGTQDLTIIPVLG